MGVRRALKIVFASTVTGIGPAAVVVAVRDPVAIMSASGIVATIHTPLIVLATLAVNRRIPEAMRPSGTSAGLLAAAGVFYTGFALAYLADLAGWFGS